MRLARRSHTVFVLCAVLVFVNAAVLLAVPRVPSRAQSVTSPGVQFRAIRWQSVANQCATNPPVGQVRDACVLAAEQLFRGQTMEGWEFVTFITPPGLLIFRSR